MTQAKITRSLPSHSPIILGLQTELYWHSDSVRPSVCRTLVYCDARSIRQFIAAFIRRRHSTMIVTRLPMTPNPQNTGLMTIDLRLRKTLKWNSSSDPLHVAYGSPWGFRGWRIERHYFRSDQVQDGDSESTEYRADDDRPQVLEHFGMASSLQRVIRSTSCFVFRGFSVMADRIALFPVESNRRWRLRIHRIPG